MMHSSLYAFMCHNTISKWYGRFLVFSRWKSVKSDYFSLLYIFITEVHMYIILTLSLGRNMFIWANVLNPKCYRQFVPYLFILNIVTCFFYVNLNLNKWNGFDIAIYILIWYYRYFPLRALWKWWQTDQSTNQPTDGHVGS